MEEKDLFNGVEVGMLPERERELSQRYLGFPEDLSFNEFRLLSPEIRRQVILRNPIIQTDSYNRTMEHLAGEDWDKEGVYVLQFRKGRFGYLIAAGIRDAVQSIADIRISQAQLDFARDYFQHVSGVPYFNPEKWESVIQNHGGRIPMAIHGVKDGTAVLPGDPILRVEGPNELVAHFEPYFHRIFYPTLVATNASRIAESVGPDRFIEVGLRGAEDNDKHLSAVKAMYIGGGIRNTSSDMAAAYYPQFNLVGTIGHRFIQSFKSEEEAFRTAVEKLSAVTLLVDLNDTYEGIEKALKLKKEYRESGKKIWMRLDSGDLLAQCVYALRRQEELGFIDPVLDKIVVEGLESIEELSGIEEKLKSLRLNPQDFVLYGAGALLGALNTSRNDASSGFKLARFAGRPTAKFSDSRGKESLPGVPLLGFMNGKRVVAQLGEPLRRTLFVPYYVDKKIIQPENIDAARITAGLTYQEIKCAAQGRERTALSPRTSELLYALKPQHRLGEVIHA